MSPRAQLLLLVVSSYCIIVLQIKDKLLLFHQLYLCDVIINWLNFRGRRAYTNFTGSTVCTVVLTWAQTFKGAKEKYGKSDNFASGRNEDLFFFAHQLRIAREGSRKTSKV